jgi:predicted phosphoribosyltransferase
VATPPDFAAVGFYYCDFGQLSDEEVGQILDAAAQARGEREA